MDAIVFTTEMGVVLGLLSFTVFLFVSEIIRIDLAALLVLVTVGILSYLPGLESLADVNHLFDGFASNAVISIIAVMIVGAGLDRTGIMNKVAAAILKHGGTSETRVLPIVSGTVGFISSFLQNVGAAALFLPVVSRISVRSGIPLSRLLMPMGFCAILGGTMTMVGSSPLILLNDLILTANEGLPDHLKMEPFGLFSVAPVGAALIVTGIVYFLVLGRWVLPGSSDPIEPSSGQGTTEYLERVYGLHAQVFEVDVPADSPLVGQILADINNENNIYIISTFYRGKASMIQILTAEIAAPCRLAIIGSDQAVHEFAERYKLMVRPDLDVFIEEFAPTNAGVAELVIPPDSKLIGKSPRDILLRKTYGLGLMAIHRGEETLSHVKTEDHEATQIGLVPFHAGDMLVAHTRWDNLTRLKRDRDFIVVTTDFPQEELRPHKVSWALFFFLISLSLILFTDVRLSLCLLTGAVGMLLSRVLSIDEAYRAVGWNTVFLLASLIPLGQAVQNTGTAEWIAQQILTVLDGWPIWSLQAGVAVLATVFSLVMSNVGATVLLVPLSVSIAVAAGANPAIFALTVAISTSNSFIIPTHQVNALIMGPAGYKVMDFVKSGGIMTILFLLVSLVMLNVVF
ncbi:Di- and tricarboxylate transporter [Aliiroseovarius halocynthiae]|uniref:SLC13 family permease n=1 Tax=Aliiroseovarius halocynthiae TaxID=985055 RepID=A0A545SVL2_9RHOB|nr:SLC13 family permease [Aliiroseovarius halocynthiae]TQV69008.1 SLC13 family permease [Aliiroseovarius halocynthiae]SMR71757.1 Di- and tricarboxylate transporter [Aliiroseovarius halocynthiae]